MGVQLPLALPKEVIKMCNEVKCPHYRYGVYEEPVFVHDITFREYRCAINGKRCGYENGDGNFKDCEAYRKEIRERRAYDMVQSAIDKAW